MKVDIIEEAGHEWAPVLSVDQLGDSERGAAGFGSTGSN